MSDNEDMKVDSTEVSEDEVHEDELTDGDVDELKEESSQDLELSIVDLNVQSGTVAVTWCVTPELLKSLADKGIRDPQVVIVTASADSNKYHVTKEYRTVTPLKDLMSYVEFRSAGPCKVWGFVYYGKARDAKNRYLGRRDGAYSTDILNRYGDNYSYDSLIWDSIGTGRNKKDSNYANPIEVEVPAGVFAPEPSAFEKNWVNWLFRQKCVDQCSFRRRRMFAYSLQLFPFIGTMLLRLVVTIIALLVGGRGITLDFLFSPLSTSVGNLPDLFDGTFFVKDIELEYRDPLTTSYLVKKYWALPFMPIIFLTLCFTAYLASQVSFGIILTIAFSILILVGGIIFFAKYLNSFLDRREEELRKLPMSYLQKEEMDLIVCSNKKIRRLSDLPSHKRTFKLRFQNLKSKVCRPFSV